MTTDNDHGDISTRAALRRSAFERAGHSGAMEGLPPDPAHADLRAARIEERLTAAEYADAVLARVAGPGSRDRGIEGALPDPEDGYVVPGLPETVLWNQPGLTDPGALAAFEAEVTLDGAASLATDPLPRTWDRAHLAGLHGRIFGGVYPWAGRMRDEAFVLTAEAVGGVAPSDSVVRIGPKATLGKGGSGFAHAGEIEGRLAAAAERVASADAGRGTSPDAFADLAAEVLAEVNAVHPFREGNGRAQRAYLDDLALAAGHLLDWTVIDGPRNVAASIAAGGGDLAPMRAMLADAVVPERRALLLAARAALAGPEHAWLRAAGTTMRTLAAAGGVRGTVLALTDAMAVIADAENALVAAPRGALPAELSTWDSAEIEGGSNEPQSV